VKYNYDKLKGRIKEYFGTQDDFARSINLSAVSVNMKLNNKTRWTQDEIMLSIDRLNIKREELVDIFFTKEVEKN